MNINFSSDYTVKRPNESDINDIYELLLGNEKFCTYSCEPASPDGIRRDMCALPPNKTSADKFYLGLYQNNSLCAVLDLIEGYPTAETAYIGLLITKKELHGTGVGSKIITELKTALKQDGFKVIRLGVIKENTEALGFWKKQGFKACGEEIPQEKYTVVPMQTQL